MHAFAYCISLWILLVVGTSLIRQPSNKSWNSGPMNSPPLSWMHYIGHGYHESQICAYFLTIVANFLSSILTSYTRLDIVSIMVSALNSNGLSRTWIIQGPIKSTAHSSNGIDWISHSSKCPYLSHLAYCAGSDHNCNCRSGATHHGDNSVC